MFRVKNHYFSLSLFALLALSGCAGYKAKPLSRLGNSGDTWQLTYDAFDKKKCKKYLGRDVLAKGYQPVQIRINNNSSNSVYFSRKNISLSTADPLMVAKEVHFNTVGRAVGYGTAAAVSSGWFAIPAIVDGIGAAESNDKMDFEFNSKALCDQEIASHDFIEGLVFVPVEKFKPNFTVTLSNQQTMQRITLKSM